MHKLHPGDLRRRVGNPLEARLGPGARLERSMVFVDALPRTALVRVQQKIFRQTRRAGKNQASRGGPGRLPEPHCPSFARAKPCRPLCALQEPELCASDAAALRQPSYGMMSA